MSAASGGHRLGAPPASLRVFCVPVVPPVISCARLKNNQDADGAAMSFFTWSPKFELGVPSMNDEHKVIVGLMNRLWEQNQSGASQPELIDTLRKLHGYTAKHFADEEAYMESIVYPEIESHRNIHKNILHRLSLFRETYESQNNRIIPPDFFTFLKDWLTAHICYIDKKYVCPSSEGDG
jgi:hemerythrin-like metal-binding protein